MSHTCHEEPPPCPPCAYLTTKQCACGKKDIGNVKCSLEREKVSCAATCGRSVHRMSGFETTHRMNVPGCWAVDFTVVRNCVMQVIAGRVQLSAVKIASYGMSVSVRMPFLCSRICKVCQRIIHVHDLVMHLQPVPKMSHAKHW
jgi:hypothetical protein